MLAPNGSAEAPQRYSPLLAEVKMAGSSAVSTYLPWHSEARHLIRWQHGSPIAYCDGTPQYEQMVKYSRIVTLLCSLPYVQTSQEGYHRILASKQDAVVMYSFNHSSSRLQIAFTPSHQP